MKLLLLREGASVQNLKLLNTTILAFEEGSIEHF